MREDLVERDPSDWLDLETAPDEIAALRRESGAKVNLRRADLLVLLKWDVSADHVVEEDAKRPDGGRGPVVAVESDPLWGRIDTRTWKEEEKQSD